MDVGELELIERIRERIGAPGRATLVGIGDDAAVLEQDKGLLLFTSDAFVESVHFRREYSSFREIGAKLRRQLIDRRIVHVEHGHMVPQVHLDCLVFGFHVSILPPSVSYVLFKSYVHF